MRATNDNNSINIIFSRDFIFAHHAILLTAASKGLPAANAGLWQPQTYIMSRDIMTVFSNVTPIASHGER